MLKCSDCEKTLGFTNFNRNRTTRRGYSYVCKTCLKLEQKKRKSDISKEEAEAFLEKLNGEGKEYKCSKCLYTKLAGEFYYKRDRGNVYVNTTACRECTKAKQRLTSFGISAEKYEEMLMSQDSKCAICSIHIDEYRKTSQNNKVFAVDHCHSTGSIRGLLCCKCNRGLGYFKDDPALLHKAISYLKDGDMV